MKKFKTLLFIRRDDLKFGLKPKLTLLLLALFSIQINAKTNSPSITNSFDVKNVDFQELTIAGQITDQSGMPLPGASVLVKGTNNGVSTDFDGNYEIKVSNNKVTLVFSYLGFVTQELTIDGQSTLNVSLIADNTDLDEIVIVGYGTQRKKDVAGAIATVKTDDLVLSSSPSIGDVLRGKASGLQITQNSAQPGGGLDIQIRGAGSINASNEPLVVVDGFPITNFDESQSGNRYDSGTQSILNSFNPNDIESISVLKDASATSIYGARAANGVILLTTKKGKSGKVQVDYNTSFSYQPYNNSFDVLNLQEWMELRNEVALENWEFRNNVAPYGTNTLESAIANPVNGVAFSRFYSDEEIQNAGPGTNWVDLVTRDGSTQQHNLSLRGGNETTKYYLSGNLYEQKGVLKNSAFDRASLRLNLDQKINDYVNVGLNLTTSRIVNANSQLGDGQFENSGLIYSALKYGPHIQAIDEFGNYPINPDNSQEPNPYSLLTITDEGIIDRSLTNFFMEVKPITGLVARFQVGFDQGNTARNTYLPRTTLWGELENGKASIYNQKKNDQLFDFTLNYSKLINNDHNFNFLVGYSRQKFRTESASSGNSGFKTDAFLWNNLNAGEGTKVLASSKSEENWVSYFGRLNYIYKDRYILTSSIRRDGSSKFATNNQFAVFSSIALAWDLAEEPFMKKFEKLSQLKFRVGYGETGNSDFPENAFAAYEYFPAYLGPDESILVGAFQTRLENPDLKWETTRELNLGLDFGFFDGRISGALEVYSKNIEDLLQEKAINSYNPLNTVWANVGSTQSRGVELTLNTVNIDTDNLKWSSSFTFSKFEDKWKERAEDWKPSVYESADDPIRARYSYISDGIMQIGDVVDAQPDLIPGQIKIKDVNGFLRDELGNPITDDNGVFLRTGESDGIIDAADTVLMGSTDPDFIAGFSNTISYKNFDLNFHFNGMFGREMVDPTDLALGVSAEAVATNGQNVLRSVYDRWTPENQSTTRPSSYYGYPEYGPGDFFLQDAWFIRLQNVSLAYNIPQSVFGKVIKNATVRLDAQNLFVITPYNGVDPETDAYAAAYPNVKTYTIGLDLKF
jgi:TonB-linked SusC/RagA family outer membrane protein